MLPVLQFAVLAFLTPFAVSAVMAPTIVLNQLFAFLYACRNSTQIIQPGAAKTALKAVLDAPLF